MCNHFFLKLSNASEALAARLGMAILYLIPSNIFRDKKSSFSYLAHFSLLLYS